jgi:hypothetical protein
MNATNLHCQSNNIRAWKRGFPTAQSSLRHISGISFVLYFLFIRENSGSIVSFTVHYFTILSVEASLSMRDHDPTRIP